MEQGLLRTTDEEKLTPDNQGYSQQHDDSDTSTTPSRPQTRKMATSKRLLLVLVGLVVLMGLVNARPCMEAIQTGSVRLKTTFERRQAPPNSSTPVGETGQDTQTGTPEESQTGNPGNNNSQQPGGDPTNNNPPPNGKD